MSNGFTSTTMPYRVRTPGSTPIARFAVSRDAHEYIRMLKNAGYPMALVIEDISGELAAEQAMLETSRRISEAVETLVRSVLPKIQAEGRPKAQPGAGRPAAGPQVPDGESEPESADPAAGRFFAGNAYTKGG